MDPSVLTPAGMFAFATAKFGTDNVAALGGFKFVIRPCMNPFRPFMIAEYDEPRKCMKLHKILVHRSSREIFPLTLSGHVDESDPRTLRMDHAFDPLTPEDIAALTAHGLIEFTMTYYLHKSIYRTYHYSYAYFTQSVFIDGAEKMAHFSDGVFSDIYGVMEHSPNGAIVPCVTIPKCGRPLVFFDKERYFKDGMGYKHEWFVDPIETYDYEACSIARRAYIDKHLLEHRSIAPVLAYYTDVLSDENADLVRQFAPGDVFPRVRNRYSAISNFRAVYQAIIDSRAAFAKDCRHLVEFVRTEEFAVSNIIETLVKARVPIPIDLTELNGVSLMRAMIRAAGVESAINVIKSAEIYNFGKYAPSCELYHHDEVDRQPRVAATQ